MISVIIPSYNHAQFIEITLQPLLKNIDIFKQIIIVDDCSTDKTPEIADKLAASHSQITVIRKNKNKGVADSLNIGLTLVTEQFVYLCASDDVPDPAGIRLLSDKLLGNMNLKFVLGNGTYIKGDARSVIYKSYHEKFLNSDINWIRKNLFINYPKPLLLQASLFRADMLIDIGGWDPDITIDDHSLFIKMFRRYTQNNYDYFPFCNACFYRIHEANFSGSVINQFSTQIQLIEKYCVGLEKYNAIAYRYMFHFMSSIKKHKFADAIGITKLVNTRIVALSFKYIPQIIIEFYENLKSGT